VILIDIYLAECFILILDLHHIHVGCVNIHLPLCNFSLFFVENRF